MVHPSLRAQFNHISHHVLVPGRAHTIKCTGKYGTMHVFNIHIQPEQHRAEQNDFLRLVKSKLAPQSHALSFITGDFNFAAEGEASARLSGRRVYSSHAMA
eukprot:1755277-Pyramimonas_sp.AAC.1